MNQTLLRPLPQKIAPAKRPVVKTGVVDFVIIGAMRAGTTTLHSLLSQHPQITMSRDKETDFFIAEKNWHRGLDWYQDQFDHERPIRGEASPNYSKGRDFPQVPARLAQHAPGAHLIYVVRDPVARARSQYTHSWNMGELRTPPAELPQTHEYGSLIDASSYARQLDLWRKHFPDQAIMVVDFDQLISNPQEQMNRILQHIGADPMTVTSLKNHNDTAQLSRVPRPLMRLAHSRLRPLLTGLLDQRRRDRLRQLLAIGPGRRPPEFPDPLCARMRHDLVEDIMRFRRMTGMEFSRWSI